MATMTKQQVKANWLILEDYPTRDGEYVVCFLTDEGTYNWPDIWYFHVKTGWVPVYGQEHESQPTHWCDLPMPR
jgi:hypothetical protein